MAKAIMVQGTASNVGKSVLVAALCRIFYQDGYRVVPFKSQNMALNSFVTADGEEMGRAQVVQAQASGLAPQVEMNPVLLKPTGNASSQVIVMGKPVGNMSARDYHQGKNIDLLNIIKQAYAKLDRDYDIIVIEGAGSPAEVNLKARDIVNMRIARLTGAPVLLAADIDRGGCLASIVGTLALLEPDEQDMVQGIVINKFRGDISLLEPALDFLKVRTGKPVLGVVPYFDFHIPAEDSVCLEGFKSVDTGGLDIAVVYLPRISNFTDFDALALEPGVKVRYVKDGEKIGEPDLVILPGTKNTLEDLMYLYQTGYAAEIRKAAAKDVPVCGLCGGYQILGKELHDYDHTESGRDELPGLGLLDQVTSFVADKVLAQAEGELCGSGPIFEGVAGHKQSGYEIHMGRTVLGPEAKPFLRVLRRQGRDEDDFDGAVSSSGLVWGTYFHGIFDNDIFRSHLLQWLRRRKGITGQTGDSIDAAGLLEREFDRLAGLCRQSLDTQKIYRMLDLPEKAGPR